MEIKKKVCLIGDFAVGKTSLVQRFVHNTFSDKYLTTVGVKIDTRVVEVGSAAVKLVLWDIYGDHTLTSSSASYMAGANGFLLVVDGTRSNTLHTAMRLKRCLDEVAGDVPGVWLLNKSDLAPEWELGESELAQLDATGCPVLRTSARSGDNVEQAFALLAGELAA